MDSRRWLYLGSATTFAILPLFLVVVLSQETEKYNFGPFNHSMINRELYVIPMAWLNFSDLQLSPYSADGALRVNSGRVFINKPFKLWDDTRIASFNTSFLMNIYRVRNNTPGEGIAFIIGPSLSIPPLSYGNYLGLTNQLTDGNSSNQIVAVEFDTVKQDFDPDDNHVGLDINGVVSKVTVPLSKFGWLQVMTRGSTWCGWSTMV
ncbi:putative L-type lectin-domain containing receptor kinase S [Arachis hypogaea]|nr:putative L-type lectin-domain containing receptor kinase S [Arachis hypogaea]